MKGRTAGLIFLCVCVVLAVLVLLRVIVAIASGIIFAVALVTLGILSGGFRRQAPRNPTGK